MVKHDPNWPKTSPKWQEIMIPKVTKSGQKMAQQWCSIMASYVPDVTVISLHL